MEGAFRPLTSAGNFAGHAAKAPSFPRPAAPPTQPPLLPLPVRASPHYSWPASLPAPPGARKPRRHDATTGASAPITVTAPSKKRAVVEWAENGSLYSVSPPPSSVPMPTSLLVTATAGRKAPTACAVEVAGASGGVDAGATNELRRLLRLQPATVLEWSK